MNLTKFTKTACLAADEARTITRKWFRQAIAVDYKQDQTPVTIADQQTEQRIKTIILDRHPEHGVFGEESGAVNSQSEWQWVIDPIDGTKSFATGLPTFGTLIALLHQGIPKIGIIDLPVMDERWLGISGETTTHNGNPCTTRTLTSIAAATAYTTTPDMFNHNTAPRAENLTQQCKFRVFGGDCYSYGLIASGYNDLTCEADLKPYDYLALIPVVQGAGGLISDWQGEPLSMHSNGEVLACGCAEIHNQAIQILNQEM